MTTLRVESAVAGSRVKGEPCRELSVSLPPESPTLGDLIEAVVRAEVVAFHARAADERSLRLLSTVEIARGLAAGALRSGGREMEADVSGDEAVRVATQAQQDGLYMVIVDDEPVDGLDDLVQVPEGTRIMFLRLVALTGG